MLKEINPNACKKCGLINQIYRLRFNYQNNKYYLQSTCISCEREGTKSHQENNREYWRKLNCKHYRKNSEGEVSRRNILNRTEEDRKQRKRDKSNLRSTRTKLARFDDELTLLVVKEAHELRKLRNKLTGLDWHVDHIVPLKNKMVCGLHIWSNIAVIPKVDNLRKGNYYSIHA